MGGVSTDAPFHGFTIFLDTFNLSGACIDFEIHLKVDKDEKDKRPYSAHEVRLGNLFGLELTHKEKIMGMDVKIVRTSFSYKKGNDIIDGAITMSVLEKDYVKGKAIYDNLLNSFRFNVD